MRVLWITNIPLPPICDALGWQIPAVGGWMYSTLKRVANLNDIEFAIASVYSGNKLIFKEIDNYKYYLLPLSGCSAIQYNRHLEKYWKDIQETFRPDVVHIHGSEYPHGLAYVRVCGTDGVVVSIQGIVSAYCRYYTLDGVHKSLLTFRDFLKNDSITKSKRKFEKRGVSEKELLSSVEHIIGRTEWDKAHTWALNPDANYYYCGETLRDSFYKHKWNYSKCNPYTIFVSQASYPIKGMHKLLEAMPLVLRKYPDTKVYVAGNNPASLQWWRITGYGKYIKSLITKYNLEEHIIFTGMLSEEDMCKAYLNANIFVCPSAIENSPNSLGEAQLLEMPYIAAYVGGVPELVKDNPAVMYRFEETEMLAKKICELFDMGASFKPVPYDKWRYDGEYNASLLNEIYRTIMQEQ
ncbi:MAG: glycosyltransferase [Bacteroidales bacterium]|nr:glycosyltransferase [Bacteroidales bacterium]